jgi:large subunit ribosomal protein L7/L12
MAEITKIVDEIKGLTVKELNELVKTIEEEFGVSASAMMMAAAPAAGGGTDAGATEKSEYDVHLVEVGANKMNVIKAVKLISGLGLKEAKDLIDGVPSVIKKSVPDAEAQDMKKKLEEAGAKVELK